jgi:hypothetical protein
MSRPFTEVRHVQQTPGEPHKRWFQSDYFDLFIWTEPDGQLWGFRLCYDRCYDERALTWRRATGLVSHHLVQQGDGGWGFSGTPMLRPIQRPIPAELLPRFNREGTTLPDDFRELVRSILVGGTTA